MTPPAITGVELAGERALPLLVVGPSLGTCAESLWGEVAARLGDSFHVVGWNLPGHAGAPVGAGFTMAELAAGVADWVEQVRADATPVHYAGVSVGGAVGLRLLLDRPDLVASAALLCTGATIGDPAGWRDRAAAVRARGTSVLLPGAAERWFAPGPAPTAADRLLGVLRDTDTEGYAQVCDALAEFDVRDRLARILAPVLAVAGAADTVTGPDSLRELADGVRHGRLAVLDGVAHLAPVEAPDRVATLLRGHFTDASPYEAGMRVRRAVLGEAHVDRATAGITDVTRDFQDLITRYAWGDIWTRPGLSRRDRSIAVLTALVAGRHFDELELHLPAALRNGLTRAEIVEVLLQAAVYLGVPAANTAFAVANRVLADPS